MSDTDTPEVTAFGYGKSEAEVAFELLNKLKGQGVWGERNISAILDMYAECLDAAKGLRVYSGQNRVDVPIKSGTPAPAQTQPQQQAPAQPQVQAQAPQQVAAAPQPVHAQQQALQQAYKQG